MSETGSLAVNDINGSTSKEEHNQCTKGRKHGVKYLKERHNKGDRKLSDSPESDDGGDDDLDAKYMEYPLVSIQVFDKDNKPEKKRLRINSQHICDALAAAVESYPDQQPTGYEPPLEIESPFAILYHHRSELQGSRDSFPTSSEKRDFNDLFSYLDKEPVAAVPELVKNGLITFEFLWAVFKPGDYLRILDAGKQPQILWLKRASEKHDYMKKQPYLSLLCLYTCSNGEILGKAEREVRVYQEEFPWHGPQKITSLSAIPLKHLDDQGAALQIQTGKRAIEYKELASKKTGALRRYKGIYEALVENPGYGRPDWEPHTTVGRVLIDAKAFMEENPSKKILVTSWGTGDDSKPNKSDKPQNEASGNKDIPSERDILCPPYVYGYCIGMRKWGRFFLGQFSEPGWDEKLWSQHLILPTPQKDLLLAMVSSHFFPSDTEIHEEEALKGKGLVVVLHGPPGTGKTLTAAAIAEKTKKPLLLYPAGELGSELDTVQASIKDIIRHASRWKAILLIDEADVFLESREGPGVAAGNVNLERNALVAVFLRQLEYSQSIIFLTSNRAQMLDPAIKSRVHLSLHYPSPDPKTRRQLWEDKLAKTDPEKLNIANSDKARVLDFITRYPLNGREISNIFNSAMTLAAHDRDKKLKTVHLETVLKVWEEASDDYSRRAGEMGRMLTAFVDHALRGLCLFVLLGLAVIISLHGYQVASKGNRDILIVYR